MPSNAFQLGKLLMSSGEVKISPENVSDDFSTIEQVSSTDALSASGNAVGDQRIVGTNLYIWNGTGWYRIALINQTPTWDSGGQPAGAYVLDADSPQDPTIITLAASDPDGLPISYSYVTSGSMDSMATISQDSSVFTITPIAQDSSNAGQEFTGSITFRASDGVNILPSVSSFTLSFITFIENSKYTTLLATAAGTSDNSNITDSSTNNHTIGVFGDAHAGTFSPYRHGGYSLDIGSGSSYVYTSNHSDFAFGTGYFSVEAWINFSSFTNSGFTNTQNSTSTASSGQWYVVFVSSTVIRMGGHGAPNYTDATVAEMTVGDWHHVILKRDGNGFKVFVDGTEATSYSSSGTAVASQNFSSSSGTFTVGYSAGTGPALGKIADFRILKGGAASTSTPTERLTEITNTVLLTAHTNRIFDETGTHTLTPTGTVSVAPSGPHDYNQYSESGNGGSVYFDGSDYCTISDSEDFEFGSGDFTVECWVYMTAYEGTGFQMFLHKGGNNSNAWHFDYKNSTTELRFLPYVSNVNATITATTTLNLNQWYHVAAVRNGNTIVLYKNGKAVSSTAYSLTIDNTADAIHIGQRAYLNDRRLTGYLSDIRINKSAVYTSDFTVPTSPVSSTGSTLHVKGTDASIIDKSQSSNILLANTAVGSTDQFKFANTKSLKFYGNSNYARAKDVPALRTGDFTYEGWIYTVSGQAGTANTFFDTRSVPTSSADGFYIMHRTDNSNKFRVGTDGTVFLNSTNSYDLDTWHHWALVRSGTTCTFYINGVADATTFTSSMDITSQDVTLGASMAGTGNTWVYLQDVRISSYARYTANFTPPTEPLKG